MKGFQKNKALKNERQFPGCLGSMVNLFDLTAGVSANRLLTDKPHHDGSLSRSRSDGTRMQVYPDLRSLPSRNSHSTPMKALLAHEMSKESKSKHGPPNVVAKLMGLDALPGQQHDATQRPHTKDYPHHTSFHPGEPAQYCSQEHDFLDKRMKWRADEYEDGGDYRDVYEIQKEYVYEIQKEYRSTHSLKESPQRRTYSEKEMKKKMELVRQKFMEAKRLATNEKLCQSQEFQDAVDVLSSNKELFLEFLQDPNALISKHPYEVHSVSAPPETKRITVLKPTKMVDIEKFPARGKKNEYSVKRPAQVVQEAHLGHNIGEYDHQPTRIVVLKPNAGKMCEIKSSVSVSSPSPGTMHGASTFEAEDYRIREAREVIEENILHIHRKLMGDQRDELLMSSGFGHKTLFNKSVDQYALESVKDFEAMSPNSRHSWDCINGYGSPFSSSSFNRTSYSPDSSVCKEAKKRLSERWAMMASSGGSHEGRRYRRSSNTLGEMLALSDMKTCVMDNEGDEEREPCIASTLDDSSAIDMPENLQRSKSLPSSSMGYGHGIFPKLSSPVACQTDSLNELTKKSATSSFKGKVSSFFFSRNKRSDGDKCSPSRSTEESESAASDTPESSVYPRNRSAYYVNEFAEDSQLEECSSHGISFSTRSSPDLAKTGKKQCAPPKECTVLGSSIENPNQPSPISVLELPYEEDDVATPGSSGKRLPIHPSMSNLISKSPPIESVARTLSWDDSCSGSASPDPSEPASHELVEQDWLFLVREILSAAGFNGETQCDTSFNWHSTDTPLDPSLRDKLANANEEEPLHEAKRRQRRSNRKLVFDCVNEALAEIIGHGGELARPLGLISSSWKPPLKVTDRVWAVISECLSCKVVRDEWDGHSLAVEMAVMEEVVVVGGQWAENLRLETDYFGKEIELELLRELVDEILIDLL